MDTYTKEKTLMKIKAIKEKERKKKIKEETKTFGKPLPSDPYHSYKFYAQKYDIPLHKAGSVPKSVNQLLNEIYEYERAFKPKGGLYPFLYIS